MIATSTYSLLDDLLRPLREAHEAQRAYLATEESRRFDVRTALTLITAAVMLALQAYVFTAGRVDDAIATLRPLMPSSWSEELAHLSNDLATMRIAALTYWVIGQVITYLVLPGLVVKLVFRDSLADYGLKLRGMFKLAWVYAAMYLVMAGPILWASTRASFQHTYPFYHVESGAPFWPRMIYWELLYALQFISLEFFFRGFLLHGCRRRFGAYSIFVMTVPYCMIHFQKPMLETMGAIAAGLVLGYMSLRTRSIWLGSILHIAVAWTMDAAAVAG